MNERILLLYNEPILPETHPDYISEIEVLDNVEAVEAALLGDGYQVEKLGLNHDPVQLWQALQTIRPDAVFNLYEGSGTNNLTEVYVAALLDWANVAYTGCPLLTLQLAQQKPIVKQLMVANGIPTPAFRLINTPDEVDAAGLHWPLIVKPCGQDCSIGLSQESVVVDAARLAVQVRRVLDVYGPPVLVEEFIDGRELTIGLVEMPELRTLPLTETVFLGRNQGFWSMLSYDAKWTEASPEFNQIDYKFDAPVSPEVRASIEMHSRKLFHLLGARDKARVDVRLRNESEVFLLELNPNPDFAPERALMNNLEAAGVSHTAFCLQLVRNALARRVEVTREARYEQLQVRPA